MSTLQQDNGIDIDCNSTMEQGSNEYAPCAAFDSDLMLGGVIFNRIGGDSHNHWLQEAVESSGINVTVLGGIPKVT